MSEKDEIYPGVVLRVKAVVADTVVLVLFMISITFLFSKFESVPDNARIVAFLFIFCFYDPIFTSFFGGTIGHKMNGIQVKRFDKPEKNIPVHLALIRFVVKYFLGWISLLTVPANEDKKAIHDMIAGSIVTYDTKKSPLSEG